MKALYSTEPQQIEYDIDGTFVFRWNIESYENENDETEWTADEVRTYGFPDKDTIKRAIIKDRYDADKEFSIINKYNSHVLGISVNPDAVTKYTEYLNFLKEIDEVICSDIE